VQLPLQTSLPLNVRPYYYRIELPLSAGQFPPTAEDNLLQELQRLQFTAPSARDMSAARQDALNYLDTTPVREWFASHGITDRRDEGVQWLEAITADDIRAAARDLLIMNHVMASWPPKPKETSVTVESLTPSPSGTRSASPAGRSPNESQPAVPAGEGSIAAFPQHMDAPTSTSVPERLSSGVSLVSSTAYAVFVSGGALTRLNHEPSADDLKLVAGIRAERILVLAPKSSLDAARQVWSSFKGSTSGPTGVPKGKVSTGDFPAMFILKTLLDLKLIDAGWWRDAQLRIDATNGSDLQINANDPQRAQIMEWIKSIGMNPPADNYFNWAREVAVHRFPLAMPDLQALTWERDPQGTMLDLSTISPQLVQDVARIYF
ncbi:MAG TPA: hypothetical protein VKY31_05450, partial [Terriglobia bacterium]|nr:hypothetical protein [Terriglobia bacterium]